MTYTERKATIGENLLSQLRSLSHLSLSIIQAAPFTQNTVCFLSYTSCHCLKQWDSSLSSNACCDVYVVLVFTQWNTGKLQNTEYSHYRHLRNVIVGNVYSDAGTWWQRLETAMESPVVFPHSCLPSWCPQAGFLSEIWSPKLKFAFLAYNFNLESLKAEYSEIQLVTSFQL